MKLFNLIGCFDGKHSIHAEGKEYFVSTNSAQNLVEGQQVKFCTVVPDTGGEINLTVLLTRHAPQEYGEIFAYARGGQADGVEPGQAAVVLHSGERITF